MYIGDDSYLQIHMELLRDDSKTIQLEVQERIGMLCWWSIFVWGVAAGLSHLQDLCGEPEQTTSSSCDLVQEQGEDISQGCAGESLQEAMCGPRAVAERQNGKRLVRRDS